MTIDTSINIANNFQFPDLPVSIIWPDDPDEVPWFMARLYEEMAYAINSKDNGIFQMAISNNATLIPNMNAFGAYIITVSGSGPYTDANGVLNSWPSQSWSLNKSDPLAGGVITPLSVGDPGVGPTLGGVFYTISTSLLGNGSLNTYFFIKHSKAGITGSFSVNIQGTQ
jgi:hypothetical protein